MLFAKNAFLAHQIENHEHRFPNLAHRFPGESYDLPRFPKLPKSFPTFSNGKRTLSKIRNVKRFEICAVQSGRKVNNRPDD